MKGNRGRLAYTPKSMFIRSCIRMKIIYLLEHMARLTEKVWNSLAKGLPFLMLNAIPHIIIKRKSGWNISSKEQRLTGLLIYYFEYDLFRFDCHGDMQKLFELTCKGERGDSSNIMFARAAIQVT